MSETLGKWLRLKCINQEVRFLLDGIEALPIDDLVDHWTAEYAARLAKIDGVWPRVGLVGWLEEAGLPHVLRAAGLCRADLADADLSGVDLGKATLIGARLAGADLRCADLRMANLAAADMSASDITGARLSGARLDREHLRHIGLRDADMAGGAYLDGAYITGTDLAHAATAEREWAEREWAESEADMDGEKRVSNDGPRSAKHDKGKRPWHLAPWGPLGLVVDVLAHGAEKYGARSWQGLDSPRERYSSALMRHAVAVMGGEWADEESGLPHWAHVGCNALFLLWFGEGAEEDKPMSVVIKCSACRGSGRVQRCGERFDCGACVDGKVECAVDASLPRSGERDD